MPMFSLDFGYNKSDSDHVGKRSLSRSISDETLRGSLKKAFGQPHYKSAVEASGKLDFGELELELYDSRYMLRRNKEAKKWAGWCRPSCIPISIILILIVLVVVLSLLDQKLEQRRQLHLAKMEKEWELCRRTCKFEIVESIPVGLTYNNTELNESTFDGWMRLINSAKETIEIGSFYWNLRDHDFNSGITSQGEKVYQALLESGTKKNISIKIVQNFPSETFPNHDTAELEEAGAAYVRSINFDRLLDGGVLHTKMWLVDRSHMYVGSANFDWKSLTEVKELGALVTNCSCIGNDLGKIFDVYWELGMNDSTIPSKWPNALSTVYNKDDPMNISFGDTKYHTYLSSSPPEFCPKGRTSDIDAIIDIIQNATEYIHVAVMDYSPSLEFTAHHHYWPKIDDALKSAAINRGIKLKLLISKWPNTKPSSLKFLNSLQALNGVYENVHIQIKLFEVPSTPEQKKIPFARVNHNKYMVTDNTAYIGTSNWEGDYFTSTAGVGFILTPLNTTLEGMGNIQKTLSEIFNRDWESSYASPLEHHKIKELN